MASYSKIPSTVCEVPVVLPPCQHLDLSIFPILVILMSVKLYLIKVLICIFFMNNDVEDPFTCLLAIPLSSFITSMFKIFPNL